jgi:hypothetical protein
MGGGSGAFVTIGGVASDDVARLEVLLSDRQTAAVPLVDNAFVVDVPRANLPARLVAYDDADRVIGVSDPWADFGAGSSPAKGRAVSLLRVTGPEGAKHVQFLGSDMNTRKACAAVSGGRWRPIRRSCPWRSARRRSQ